jgi:flagellar biogenesis protein FliO
MSAAKDGAPRPIVERARMPMRVAIAGLLVLLAAPLFAPLFAIEEPSRSIRFPLASHSADAAATAEAATSTASETSPRAAFLPLAPPRSKSAPRGETPRTGAWPSLASIGGSLAVVIGLFVMVVWLTRRANGSAGAALPKEVFEVLGRAPLAPRTWAGLVRCGGKLLLVSFTASGVDTLTEITDLAEIDRLTGLCQAQNPKSASAAFRGVLQQMEQLRA